ncbi:hypothetical protein BDZ94DRAFT_1243560 [Collybia nuda]|uniref:Uncharacterized protein n=1 Tax=Collybia nuda TaxID=64659 RepID=A0A9P5YHC2_9AGAR|nr:hypothetical protein BDZ94DRAFT_1243560 [Collybia nuda]
MIRRNPTLIPMGDFDVQDVRDLLAQQRAEAINHQHQLNIKRKAQTKNDSDTTTHLDTVKDTQQVLRRLGLQPESGS